MNFDFKQFYLSPEGRVNRQQWWLRLMLPWFVVMVVLTYIDLLTGNFSLDPPVGLLSGLFALLTLVPSAIVHIKRFHDRDKSGWWVLIVLIPYLGAIWMIIELGFLPGTQGPNRFGPPVEYGAPDSRLG
jgi:uncharacterized membrane protein YhaH (DUF805 family)